MPDEVPDRLAVAADLLRQTNASIDSLGRQVGYGSAFALSKAFKRHFEISPREYGLAAAG